MIDIETSYLPTTENAIEKFAEVVAEILIEIQENQQQKEAG